MGSGDRGKSQRRARARKRRTFAVEVVDRGVGPVETNPRRVDVGHLAKQSRKLAHALVQRVEIQNGGCHFVHFGGGLLPAEIGNFLGARFVLQSSALPRQIFERLLVGTVGGQPDLAPQFVVVVLKGQLHAAPVHAHHARTAKGERAEVGVVESVIPDPHFDAEFARVPLATAEQTAEGRRAALGLYFAHEIGNEVGLL